MDNFSEGERLSLKKRILIGVCTSVLILVLVPMVFAEEDTPLHVIFVEMDEQYETSLNNTSFTMNAVKTAIYSPIQQSVVITIYVQSSDNTPLGVAMVKTTLLAGETPIEYGFTIPNECHYDSRTHYPICTTDTEKIVYVNVFSDFSFTYPLSPEFGVWA